MLRPLDPQAVQPTVQTLLAFLDDESVSVPGNMVENIVSGKSLLRAILAGKLVVAQNMEAPAQNDSEGEPADPTKPVAKKKAKKKAASKAA